MKRIVQTTLALAVLTMAGCSNEDSTMSAGQAKEEVQEAATATAQYMNQQKQQFVQSIQASMDEVKANTDALKKDVQAAGGKPDGQLEQHIKLLEDKVDSAQAQLDELKNSSGEAWEDMKQGMKDAVADLKQSYNQAVKKFNSKG